MSTRDQARDTAARLEAELARGFRTAAPDITLSRTHDDPATPNNPDPVHGIVQIRPGSGKGHTGAHGPRKAGKTRSSDSPSARTALGAHPYRKAPAA